MANDKTCNKCAYYDPRSVEHGNCDWLTERVEEMNTGVLGVLVTVPGNDSCTHWKNVEEDGEGPEGDYVKKQFERVPRELHRLSQIINGHDAKLEVLWDAHNRISPKVSKWMSESGACPNCGTRRGADGDWGYQCNKCGKGWDSKVGWEEK